MLGLVADPDKPTFHVCSARGWINDPNGPLYHKGRYHLFYQHILNGCEWDFGIVWGHAVSDDLVFWEHLPPALLPSPGGADADGCFSGCCVVDCDGTPVILYTGVRLRSNPECGDLPPTECDLNLPFIESQLSAVPDPADGSLSVWHKRDQPFLRFPPENLPLVGWRDPFIFETGGDGKEWGMLLGSGLKGKGGAVLIYRSASLHEGWRYDGMLCLADTPDTGAMWECPLLLELQQLPPDVRPAGLSFPRGAAERADSGAERFSGSFSRSGRPARLSLDGPSSLESYTSTSLSSEPSSQRGELELDDNALFAIVDNEDDAVPESPEASTSGRENGSRGAASAENVGAPGADGVTRARPGVPTAPETLNGDPGRRASVLSAEIAALRLGRPPQPPPPVYTHLLCISPDAPTNPVLFWLGNYDEQRSEFMLAGAKGPRRLDLGDILYAPNLLVDAMGRHLMWGWLQERRKAGSYDYSGCMTCSRLLYIRENRLIQLPVPEIRELRSGRAWAAKGLEVDCREPYPLEGVTSPALDIELILQRGTASAAGLLFRSWNAGGEGSAVIVFDWERNVLEAVFEGAGLDLGSTPDLDPEDDSLRRVGGPAEHVQDADVHMRVLLDHSAVEVYIGSGEVLSTRVYRGHPPADADAGVDFIAFGGTARVAAVEAWEMGSIWQPSPRSKAKAAAVGFAQEQDIYQPLIAAPPAAVPSVVGVSA